MSAPYPLFSGKDAKCPKCLGSIDAEFMPEGTVPFTNSGKGWIHGTGPEWLMRTCTECGYSQAEMCADAEAEH